MGQNKKKTSKVTKGKAKAAKSGAKKTTPTQTSAKQKVMTKAKSRSKAKPLAKPKVKPQKKAKPQVKAASKGAAATKSKLQARPTKSGRAASTSLQDFMTPLDNRVVVEAEKFTQTPGGLYIPESSKDKPQRGKVLAVGRGHQSKKGKLRPMDVQVGDEVLFDSFSGLEIKVQGRDLKVLREDEILGIIAD